MVIELEWLCVNQLVVQTFANRLDNVTLSKVGVLLALFADPDVLLPELEFVLKRVIHVVLKSLGRRAEELVNALVIELVHHLVEDVFVELASLLFELFHHFLKLELHLVNLIVQKLVLELQVRWFIVNFVV